VGLLLRGGRGMGREEERRRGEDGPGPHIFWPKNCPWP